MRVWPRSLRGQVLLAALGALFAAQIVALLVSMMTRDHAVRQIRIGYGIDSAVALMQELDRTPAELREPLLHAAASPLMHYSVDPEPKIRRSDPELAENLNRVEGLSNLPADRAPKIAIRKLGPEDWQALQPRSDRRANHGGRSHSDDPRRHPEGEVLLISLSLADGEWLNSRLRFSRPRLALRGLSRLTLVLSAITIAAVVWLVLTRILGPLRRLAVAADAFGRGEVQSLPVTGPSEMQTLTEAFNRMQDRLHRLVEDRTQMLAALGHDLRSPITALRLRAEMLEDDDDRDRINTALDEMQDMVEQTLAYTQGVWTAEPVEDVDIATLLDDLAEEALIGGCPVTWSGADPLTLRLRPVAMRRALRNLIDNACRYGEGEVALNIAADQETLRITIADRGPGIPEAALERIFAPYARVEGSRSRETGGTGLGLAIVRGVARAHGGAIKLANREGGGLVATMILPRPATPEKPRKRG